MELVKLFEEYCSKTYHIKCTQTTAQHKGDIFEEFACYYIKNVKGWECWRNKEI